MPGMKDDTKAALDGIFAKHDQRKQAEQRATDERKTTEAKFLEKFLQVREGIIRPALEEIGEYVKGKGYDYEIVTRDDSDPHSKRGTTASIGIQFKRASNDLNLTYGASSPNFSVISEKGAQRVRFHENTMMRSGGGHSGPAGESKLEEVTPDKLQKMLLKI